MKRYILGLLLVATQIHTERVIDSKTPAKTTQSIKATGKLASNYGSSGKYTSSVAKVSGDIISAIYQFPDGRTLLAGKDASAGWRVEMLNADGAIDTSWGSSGAYTSGASSDSINSIAVLSDGRILLAGKDADVGWRVEMLTAKGALDTSWGSEGVYTSGASDDTINKILLLADGRIALAGHDANAGWRVEVLTAKGALDSTWGSSGAYTSSTANVTNDVIYKVIELGDKRLVVVGEDNSAGWLAEVLLQGGTKDTSWGTSGTYSSATGNASNDIIHDVSISLNGGDFIFAGNDASAGWLVERVTNNTDPLKLSTVVGLLGQ